MTKDKMKKANKYSSEKEISKEADSKEKSVWDFVKHFDTVDKPFSAYIFPHFAGDIALLQIFINPLQKEKKRKFLGIFSRKAKDKLLDEFKETGIDDFWFKSTERNNHYLKFLHKHTEQAYNTNNQCVVSMHPMNLNHFLNSGKSVIAESTQVENYILHSSWESFMEFGVSSNNNILLPLLDSIVTNNLVHTLNMVKTIYTAIMNFNDQILSYPDYKKYLLDHTNYNDGLEKTYLRVYESTMIFNQIDYINKMFIVGEPSIFFTIQLWQMILEKSQVEYKLTDKFLNSDSKFIIA